MTSIRKIILLAMQNYFSQQSLERIPEKDSVVVTQENVDQFDEIVNSNITLSFCSALELLSEIDALPSSGNALDLACGPGHFSLFLAKYGNVRKVIGVDLSKPMLEKARSNAEKMGLSHRVDFVQGDITSLPQLSDGQFDLITCVNSAHHLSTHTLLHKMLEEMSRLMTAKGTGLSWI